MTISYKCIPSFKGMGIPPQDGMPTKQRNGSNFIYFPFFIVDFPIHKRNVTLRLVGRIGWNENENEKENGNETIIPFPCLV